MSSSNNPDIVGGTGGNHFSTGAFAKVKSVNLRSGGLTDSIQLVYSTNQASAVFGGIGGAPGSFTAGAGDEVIVAVSVKSGKYIVYITHIVRRVPDSARRQGLLR